MPKTESFEVTFDGEGQTTLTGTLEGVIVQARRMAGDGWNEVESTLWVDVEIRDVDGDVRRVMTVAVHPDAPACDNGRLEHAWRDTGLQGHGGGVIYRERCKHCGVMRVTDTWATRPDNGMQGLRSVRYIAAEAE